MENRIKELREQKKISQVCLATYVGCSQNMISKIELGISEPKAGLLLELSKYFNVSIDYLLMNSSYKHIQEVYGIIKNKDNDYYDFYDFYQIFSKLTSEDKEFVLAMINKLYKEKEV